MASVKLGSLIIRTAAKPLSNKIKQQSQEHPRFRQMCIDLAQWTYRTEYRLRTGLLGESPKAIKPLSEAKAVSNGANILAEGFLFAVAAGLILGETYRSSNSSAKRRDALDDQIDSLQEQVKLLQETVKKVTEDSESRWEDARTSQQNVTRILDRVMHIGFHQALADFQETPLRRSTSPSASATTFQPSPLPLSPPHPTSLSGASSHVSPSSIDEEQ